MSESKINVNVFIENYIKAQGATIKQGQMKKLIKRTYVPVLEKRNVLHKMLELSIEETNGIKHINMFVSRINVYAAIIALYTNFELNKIVNKDGTSYPDLYGAYDLLKQYDILTDICDYIGEQEIEELITVNQNLIDNFNMDNNSPAVIIHNLADRLAQKLGIAAGYTLDRLDTELDNDDNTKSLIGKLFNN